jgi:hypothetical protein
VATAGALALFAGATLVDLVGVDTPTAFAGWSPVPTTPTSDQTDAASVTCTNAASALGAKGPAGLAPGGPPPAVAPAGGPPLFGTTGTTGTTGVTGATGATGNTVVRGQTANAAPVARGVGGSVASASLTVRARGSAGGGPATSQQFTGLRPVLTDSRGPYTLVVFASPTAAALCVSGPDLISIDGSGSDGSQFGFQAQQSTTSAGGPDMAGITALSVAGVHNASVATRVDSSNGQSFSVADGRLDADVTGVTLDLADGTKVRASTGSGWFVAWWPGTAKVDQVELTAASGVSTETVPGA